MTNDNININNNAQRKKDDAATQLNQSERDQFKKQFDNELDFINQLIEDELSDFDSSASDADNNRLDTIGDDPLEMKQSYNDQSKQLQENMRRIGLLKDDKTGRNFKASGLDH